MRFFSSIFLLSAFLVVPSQPDQEELPPLRSLLTPQELHTHERRSRYRDRMDLYRRVFDRFTVVFENQMGAGEYQRAVDELRKIRGLALVALAEPVEGSERDLRSRQVKRLEVELRKLIDGVRDYKRVAPLLKEEEFDLAIEALEDLRSRLLGYMFGETLWSPPEGNVQDQSQKDKHGPPGNSLLPAGRSGGSQSIRRSPISGDRFTEEEFDRLQLNQDLVKRVDVFLDIAESRLEEIWRRMEGRELKLKEGEQHPLEFFTYAELVRAYHRAIDGIMVNIDEKATHRMATEKDIRKALSELNRKITKFAPQLPSIKELSIELQDEVLYVEVVEAEKLTAVARKGSQYGLGAPAK